MRRSVLFLVDNVPAIEMLTPVAAKLADSWDVFFVGYCLRTERDRRMIQDCVQKTAMRYLLLRKQSRKGVAELLGLVEPSILVLTREETTPVEPWFLEEGKARGIPSLLVPHGIMIQSSRQVWGDNKGGLYRLRHLRQLSGQGYRKLRSGRISPKQLVQIGIFRVISDLKKKESLSRFDRYSMVAAYGDMMREILINRGVSPKSITVTGNPKFDSYYARPEHGQTHAGSRILLLTNYFVEFGLWTAKQREAFVLNICSVVSALSQYPLQVSIHPVLEDIRDYEHIIRKYGLPVEVFQHKPLPELIDDCDIAITISSSSGLEVMAAEKPLIIYNPYGDLTVYTEGSGVLSARNGTELFMRLLDLTKDDADMGRRTAAEAFVYDQAYLQDGKAAERIVALIEEMTGGNQKC